jgi:hypothetical protein
MTRRPVQSECVNVRPSLRMTSERFNHVLDFRPSGPIDACWTSCSPGGGSAERHLQIAVGVLPRTLVLSVSAKPSAPLMLRCTSGALSARITLCQCDGAKAAARRRMSASVRRTTVRAGERTETVEGGRNLAQH